MIEQNEQKVLALIKPGDVVLDVGGWARPFNRANYVLDRAPYATRGQRYAQFHNQRAQGGDVEHFTADTWIQRDICDRTPWPFADKSIDFCVCSNTLEDIRDPIGVCREINRVARRGYIEVPSRLFESCRGREANVPVGVSHHWWLIEIEGTHISFYPKYHFLHGDFRLSLPRSFSEQLLYESLFSWLFWDGAFTCSEGDPASGDDVPNAWEILQSFIHRHYHYTPEETAALLKIQAEYRARLDQPLAPAPIAAGPVKQYRLDEAHTGFARVEARLGALKAELEELLGAIDSAQERLSEGELGPAALRLARKMGRISRRYPRLSQAVRRMVRI